MISSCNTNKDSVLFLLVGSYSSADAEGIKVYSFDMETAEATLLNGMKGISNPSFIYPNAEGTMVYAVGEDVAPDVPTAHAMTFDKEKGILTLVNTQENPGDAPCNIIISPDGQRVYTSNYFGGNIDEYHIEADGQLGTARSIVFEGSSVDPERQTHPYLHAVNFTPDGKYLLADDLGSDKVHVFPADGPVETDKLWDLEIPAGTGPRHLSFSPNGNYAYLIGELSGDIVVIEYNKDCAVKPFKVIQVTKADTLNAGGSADIHVSNDGQFVYASHRLQGDGLSIYKINQDNGTIVRVGYQETGIHPRNFAISPNDKYLLVACRDYDMIQIFARDAETGLLTDTGKTILMSKPVCLQFIK